ncbi:MAG: cupredoxin domain-containing protein [Thermoleophilia bacterium]
MNIVRKILCRQSGLRAARIIITAHLAAALLLYAAACGGGATITMKELKFEPDTVTIKKGHEVTWKNEDRRSRQVMSGAPPVMTDAFMSPVLEKGESWTHTFSEKGEYPYHDMRIPGQAGRVIVED